MKIEAIEIRNYKSIDELKLTLKPINGKNCYILLGKNEAGKSNILNAIALLDNSITINYESDCNKSAKKKKEPIEIDYTLNHENYSFDKKLLNRSGIPIEIFAKISFKKIHRTIIIHSDDTRSDIVWIWINDLDILKNYAYNKSNDKIELIKNIYKGKDAINENNIESLLGPNYETLKTGRIETIIEPLLFTSIDKLIPKSIFWEPSEQYLINSPINLSTFSSDQTYSIPLRNIFKIAGIENIKQRIELINNNTEERKELEEELSNSITDYINRIWPEHKINIIIDIENLMCNVLIEDKDDKKPKYKMDQRSDGFKQFLSILLSLSIESNTNILKDRLILLDEPETHLHPSGIRYLRDELLNISENNIVLISTHSIYLVDKLNLERHIKVDKVQSKTLIKNIDKNNPYEEEVIYEALGTSVYEHIQPNMLVFEGKTDKDLFDSFTDKFKYDLKPLKIGTISADGVEKIPQYTKFFDGKFVKGFVILDSDNDGIRIKNQIIENCKSFSSKNTFEINDFYNTELKATLEDLYPKETIISTVKSKYNIEIELNETIPVIKQLESKTKYYNGKINVKELKGFLVQNIITDLKKLTKIKAKEKYSKYHQYLENIHKSLKK